MILVPYNLSLRLSVWGLTDDELLNVPLSKTRTLIQLPSRWLTRVGLIVTGFYWIKVKGTPVTDPSKVKIIVSNHRSFMESLWFAYRHGACLLTKDSLKQFFFFGTVTKALQNIFVSRDNSESRSNAVELIKKRLSEPNWRQIIIYPGLCISLIVKLLT